MKKENRYILTLSCKDTMGIVAAVSSFLSDNKGFIIESAQLGDETTGNFFMRTVFEIDDSDCDKITDNFRTIADKFKMQWQISCPTKKTRILLMASKQSHCLSYLLNLYANDTSNTEIVAVISNHKDVEKMVRYHDIDFHYLPVNNENRDEQESKILNLIKEKDVELTVLARYMQVLTPNLVEKLYGQAINIHHSFLPGFKGAKPYHQAFDRGVKIIGATAHYVSNDLDEGPIIEQEVTRANHAHSPNELLNLGRDIENIVLARAVNYHLENRVLLNGNKTVVFK